MDNNQNGKASRPKNSFGNFSKYTNYNQYGNFNPYAFFNAAGNYNPYIGNAGFLNKKRKKKKDQLESLNVDETVDNNTVQMTREDTHQALAETSTDQADSEKNNRRKEKGHSKSKQKNSKKRK